MATYNVTRVPPGGANAGFTLGNGLLNRPAEPKRSQLISAPTPEPPPPTGSAPTPIATYFLTVENGASSVSTPSFTPSEGEIIVVKEGAEAAGTAPADPTGTSLTFAQQQEVGSTNSESYAGLWTATVGASPPSTTVTVNRPGTILLNYSAVVERWPVGTTIGTTSVASGSQGSGAPLTTITTIGTNSTISWAVSDWNAVAPGTPTYRNSATQEAIHDRTPTNYAGYYAYQTTTTAGSYDFGMTSPTGQQWSAVGIEIKAVPGGGGTTVTVNQTTETDTAQPIAKTKIKTVLQITETDTAQLITRRKIKTVGQALETDTPLPFSKTKIKSVLQVAEVDLANPIARDLPEAINTAIETDTAQPITRRKIKVVNSPVETDSAQAIRPNHRRTLGQPIETDFAQPITKRKIRTINQAIETDLAQSIKIQGRIFQVVETDTAQPIRAIKRKTLGQPTELETALTIRAARLTFIPVNTAVEVDSPTTLRVIKRLALATIIETDVARIITPRTELPPPPDGIIATVVVRPITATVVVSEDNTITDTHYTANVVVTRYNINVSP